MKQLQQKSIAIEYRLLISYTEEHHVTSLPQQKSQDPSRKQLVKTDNLTIHPVSTSYATITPFQATAIGVSVSAERRFRQFYSCRPMETAARPRVFAFTRR